MNLWPHSLILKWCIYNIKNMNKLSIFPKWFEILEQDKNNARRAAADRGTKSWPILYAALWKVLSINQQIQITYQYIKMLNFLRTAMTCKCKVAHKRLCMNFVSTRKLSSNFPHLASPRRKSGWSRDLWKLVSPSVD